MECKNCLKKERTESEKKLIDNHLNRIIGQLNGIKKMVEDDRYCNDILIQIAAIDKSVKGLAYKVLDEHLHTCVVDSIKKGDTQVVDEILELFERF